MKWNEHKLREALFIMRKKYNKVLPGEWVFLEQNGIINGCGGKGTKIRPPMYLFFRADCNIHDFTYTQGYYLFREKSAVNRFFLRIWHRWKCDWGFYKVMISDILVNWRYYDTNSIEALKAIGMATAYFIAVRIFGGKYYGKPIDK